MFKKCFYFYPNNFKFCALKKKLKYATKKESKDAIGADRSNLLDKNDFIVLKAEVDKLNVNKLVKVLCGLNDLKTKVDYFDVSKLKTVSVDLKKLIDIVKKLLKTQNSTN